MSRHRPWICSGSYMLVHWVQHPIWGAPEFGARKLSSSYIIVTRFLLRSSTYRVLPSTFERTQVVLSLPPVESGAGTSISARTAHPHKFRLPVSLCYFRSYYSATTLCFIYIFIYLSIHSISYEPSNYVTNVKCKIWQRKSDSFVSIF